MPELNFIFCHGWGFDQRIMHSLAQALRPYFPEAQHCFYDLGFTGQTNLPEYRKNINHFYIAIGHSYGFPFLSQQPWPWSAMIAINGFTHFCKLPGKKHGLPLPILDNTYARLQTDTQKAIHEFHQRCGVAEQSVYASAYQQDLRKIVQARHADADSTHLVRQGGITPLERFCVSPNQFVHAELAKALLVLRELTIKLPSCPILALATTHDKIVTPELTHECFALSPIDLHWFPGNHLSLLTAPDHCANTIARFITQLYV